MAAIVRSRFGWIGIPLAAALVWAFLLAPLTQAAETTSPEPGGVTVRMARVKAAHDGSSNPTWADIESDGAIWDLVTLSGGTGEGRIGFWGTTNHTVRVTLDDGGQNPAVGIEVELEAVASSNFQGPMPEGDRTIKVTFGTQPQQTTTVKIDYSITRAANQPTIDTGAISVLQGSLTWRSSDSGGGGGGGTSDSPVYPSPGYRRCPPCGCPTQSGGASVPPTCGQSSCRLEPRGPAGCPKIGLPACASTPGDPVSISDQTVANVATAFPVTSTGAGRFTRGDYTLLGGEFSITYHSRASYFGSPPAGVPSQPFGTALSPVHRFIDPISGTNNYTYVRGRGEVFHFLKQSDNSYAIDVDQDLSFTKNGNDTFTVTLSDGSKEEYDTAGKLTGLVDPNGNTWSFDYGVVGSYSNALTKMTIPDGDAFELTYDADAGWVTKVYATGPATTWKLSYNASDNLTKLEVIDCQSCGAGQATRTFTYSSGNPDPAMNGNLLSAKNADGVEKLAFSYSTADKATKATVGEGVHTFEYNSGDGIRTHKGPGTRKSVFYQDGQGRITKVTRLKWAPFEPVLAAVSLAYDEADNVTKTTLADSMELISDYDSANRKTKETYNKGSLSVSRTWLYDTALDRVTKYTDFRGFSWTYQYDAEGTLTKETAPEVTLGVPSSQQALTQHFYDARGNRTKVIDPAGVEFHFFYSAEDLLTKQVSDAAAGGLAITATWSYDDRGRLTKAIDPLSQATTYEYDGFAVTKVTSPSGVISTLEYDVDGNVTRQVRASGTAEQLVTTLVYDGNERVTKQTVDPGGLALVTKFFYDADGNLTRTQDPEGDFGPTLKYDELHRITSRVWGNLTTDYNYDLAGRRTKEAGGGAITTWLYDGLGRLTKETDPLSHYRTFDYDVAGNRTRSLSYQSDDTLLAEARFYFDEVGRPYKTENMLDGTTAATSEFLHDVADRLTKQEDPLDGATTFAYDALGRLTRTTDPLNKTTDTFYDAAGQVTKTTDPLGNFAQTFYDNEGRITKSVDPLSAATTLAYDSLSRLTRTTDPLGLGTDSFYDKAGRMTKSSDPAGGEQTVEYDKVGRQTKVTVKVTATVSRSTTFSYDTLGQLTRTTDPLANNTDHKYDVSGRLTKTTDAESVDTAFLYDKAGQLTKSIQDDDLDMGGPQGLEIEVVTEYDGLGRRTRVLNDSGTAVLRFYYDRLGRQTKLEYANGDAETYAYDIASRRTKLTRPVGNSIDYQYDSRGLLTKQVLNDDLGSPLSTLSFSYDAAGRRTKADDPDTDLSWFIDAAGRVTKMTDGKLSKTLEYSYDIAGRMTALDSPHSTLDYFHDAVSRVTKITENSANRAEWLYDLSGSPTKMTYGSGSFSTWDYDLAGRLTRLFHRKSDNTVIQRFTYRLDKVGNRTKLTLKGADFVEFRYDAIYQLTKETRKASGGALQYENSFSYNRLGNRTKLIYDDGAAKTTTTYLYNSADQLTKSTTSGTDTTYSYDTNGNLTRKTTGSNNDDYFYDARNLITKFDGPGTANDTTYAWDTEDRRVKKDLNGTVTRFLYDDYVSEILAEYDGQATPALLASYIPTGLDSNVSMTRGGTLYYFHADALQSAWNLTLGSDESIQNTYQFQAFGSLYGTATENVTNTRWFTGAERNAEDSTQTHGVRRYFPQLARWNRRDPLLDVDSTALYTYVRNRATVSVDSTGLSGDIPPGFLPDPIYYPDSETCRKYAMARYEECRESVANCYYRSDSMPGSGVSAYCWNQAEKDYQWCLNQVSQWAEKLKGLCCSTAKPSQKQCQDDAGCLAENLWDCILNEGAFPWIGPERCNRFTTAMLGCAIHEGPKRCGFIINERRLVRPYPFPAHAYLEITRPGCESVQSITVDIGSYSVRPRCYQGEPWNITLPWTK